MKFRARGAGVWLVSLLLTLVSGLTRPDAGSAAGMADESRVLANLLKLHGETVSMLYSPGSLDRASHVQARLEMVQIDVRAWGGIDLGLHGLVLAPEDWRALHLDLPYGLPQATSMGLASPAWGDQQSVALWHHLLGDALPWVGGEPLRGSREEAASVGLADTMLQVECGRMAAARAIAVPGPEWIQELLAHVVALSSVAVHERERAGEIAAVYAALATRLPAPESATAYTASADLDHRLAYQPLFHRGAEIVLAKDGRKAAKTLLRLPGKNGGQLTEGDLLARYLDLKAWLYGPAPAPAH